ncbi:MAG: 50S ribosomal protein L11 [Nanoarchaeota archaeon]
MIVKMIIEGGAMKPGPTIAQQLGPTGVNLGKVITDVNTATSDFKGVKVPVEIDVNTKTKSFTIKVFSPPTAELIKKELGAEKGSGQPEKVKIGNLAIEQIISIAKTKLPNMLAKDLKNAVKLVIGSCVSLGVMIEDKNAKEVNEDIDSGVYDKEIKQEKTDVSPDKKARLTRTFATVKAKQEATKAAEEAAKLAEDAAKAALAAATPATAAIASASTPASAPVAGAKAPAEKAPAKKK